jgi:hypothetical protein
MLIGGDVAGINSFVDVRRRSAVDARPVRRHLWAAAVLAVAAVAAGASPAAAAESLAPGDSWSTVVTLPGAWTGPADRLGVAVIDLVQQENGCLPPESQAGDSSCEPEDGELAAQLTATVSAGVLTDGSCVAAGPGAPLSLLDSAVTRLSVDHVSCLSLLLDFDDAGAAGEDDNLAQSDSIAFALRIVAEGPDGVPDSGGSPAPVVPDGGTGGPAAVIAPAAAGGVPAGGQPAGGPAAAGRPAVPAPSAGAPASALEPAAGTPLGQVEAQVSLGKETVVVQTESSSTSLTQVIVLWASLLLGTVLVGWLLFLVWRRRRQGRVA